MVSESKGNQHPRRRWYDEGQCCRMPIWVWVEDAEGDAEIPNGLNDQSHWECQNCGADGGDGEEPEYRS